MNKPLLISVSGISRSGKNTFCDLLETILLQKYNLKCKHLSFAKQLRKDTEFYLMREFGFDVWDNKDKEKFRPFLVWYANLKRQNSKGLYFIEKLSKEIENLTIFDAQVLLLSDLRFAENEYDEVDFCRQNGPILHITKYSLDSVGRKVYDTPPNEFESSNDPKIKSMSDYQIEWSEVGRGNTRLLIPYVDGFIEWLKNANYDIKL